MPINRRLTKVVRIGDVSIGGNNPIAIQSMTNTKTADIEKTIGQINMLAAAGCEIIRVAVPDMESALAIREIKSQVTIPLVADIHFDYRLALAAIENGVDKLRINPGNIGDIEKVSLVAKAAYDKRIPIRIGVNSGSLEKDILKKYGGVTAEGLCESAMGHVRILEDLGFYDIVISIKASNINMCLDAYTLLSEKTDYPLHIGITEAGTVYSGTIKSAIGIGAMLLNGIGDTIRVSLTSDPIEEISCAKEILQAVGLRKFGAELISCPTCARTEIDIITIASVVEKELKKLNKPIKVAVMGCVVNGPGEAREADIGIAGGKGVGIIFKKGEIIKKVSENELVNELLKEIKGM